MRPQTTPDQRLAELAAVHHGVVGRAQLHELGFDNAAIARRIRAGRLHRLYRGVYAVGHTVLSRNGRYLAAVLACGPQAVLSHRSAAALWGMRPSDAQRIDVTVSHTSGVRTTRAIAVHRSRRPVQQTAHAGIPVTTPGQTLADLATALPRRQLENAVEASERLRLHVHIDADHPGAKRLREAACNDIPFTRSELEDAFLALCDRHGIPRPLVNSFQEGIEVDFCWARAAADRRDRRPSSRNARGVRARPRARRAADGARLAGDEVHRAAGAPRPDAGRGARPQRA